jgi:hypothetical protein
LLSGQQFAVCFRRRYSVVIAARNCLTKLMRRFLLEKTNPNEVKKMSELRWNPLLGEWTATATHRQDRTFFPPPGYCPLCPTKKGGFPTEIPAEDYDIVVFENKFPSLQRNG